MTDDKKAEITRLAVEAYDTSLMVRNLAMMNMPTDPKEQREAAIAYALAKAENEEAQRLLDAAIRAPLVDK